MDPNLLIAAAALLLFRTLLAALEAALVAVGLPRAEELAREAKPGRRSGALRALIADPEGTGATIRILDVVSAVLIGLFTAFGVFGLATHLLGPIPGAAAAATLGAVLSWIFAAVGRAAGGARGESVGLALSLPVAWLTPVLAPVSRALGLVALPFLGVRGRFALPRPPLDEMERWLAERLKGPGGRAGEQTSELIHKVLEFREKVARDVMVPRTRVVAVEVGTPIPEILRLLSEEGHSRLPVYRESLDHVLGTLHTRDIVPLLAHPELIVLRDLIRPAHFTPWSKPVDQLLRELQKKRLHMAMVVDEYGGVMGVCTLEDLLEEIVGEIHDEYEEDERKAEIEPLGDGAFAVRGATPVSDFNRTAGAELPEDREFATIAGFLNSLAGAIPNAGDRFFFRGWMFTVTERGPRRVIRVKATRTKRPPGAGNA